MPLGLSRHHDRRPADREVRFCPLGCLMRLDRARLQFAARAGLASPPTCMLVSPALLISAAARQ